MNKQEFADRVTGLRMRLYRVAILYTGREAAAIEAVDEAVYRGLKALPTLREPDYFDTWITRILINECKKELRRRKKEILAEALPETAQEAYDALPLKEAVLRLPTALKEVILLRFFADYTLAETARCLRTPQGTIVTRQRRALRLLRLALEEEESV